MDLEMPNFSESRQGDLDASCSICLETLADHRERSTAHLQCGHRFHLDCIGSAFNAKGAMQCPNCRKVEKGRWLYANGNRSSADFDLDAWVTEDFYDLNFPELPFGFQWCPFRGITQQASLIEEAESQLNSYYESLGSSHYGEFSSASSSTHVCPYLALHGPSHAMHTTPPSSSADSVPENSAFPHHSTNLGGHPSADILNSHSFTSTETQNHNWQQQQSVPFSLFGNTIDQSASQFGPRLSRSDASSHRNTIDQSASQFGPRLSRSDASSHQRLGSFVHPNPLLHGSGPHSGSNLVGSSVMGDLRSTRGHGNNRMNQQSVPSSSLQSSPFPPTRRSRPRGLTLISSLATTSSSSENSGFYGFSSVSSSANSNRSHQDAESMPRHSDRFNGWSGIENLAPLPWIPLDGESEWWSIFNPNLPAQPGGTTFLQRAIASERVIRSQADNGHQQMPPPPRRPPASYM